ncbi:MAG: CRISPR-associated endonuclease Cas2 [Acidobacteria bacterium]|nr:CRISPR-associated endonuclease Cas2 [Acidobacteriota bacterium]
MELSTLVIYDVEDDWARTRVSEACKDFGLERIQYSCFRGKLSQNKREELYERLRKIQRSWESRWRKDFPELRVQPRDFPHPPEEEASGRWSPNFKILIQPLCEKDVNGATYAYLFVDVPRLVGEVQDRQVNAKKAGRKGRQPGEKQIAASSDGRSEA